MKDLPSCLKRYDYSDDSHLLAPRAVPKPAPPAYTPQQQRQLLAILRALRPKKTLNAGTQGGRDAE
jgi:hypothetical protein